MCKRIHTQLLMNLSETVEITERYGFFKRQQKADEKVTEYIPGLRSLAKSCNFGNYLDTDLRDEFVCGLLCSSDLTVGQAKLHQGHQGIERSCLRATEAVWWPGISVQIENMINRCPECVKRSQPRDHD